MTQRENTMYKRKTRDIYNIVTNYGYGWEVECSEFTFEEAKRTAKEYRENTNAGVRIEKKREPIQDTNKSRSGSTFIKYILEVEVDGLRSVNHYKISGMYSVAREQSGKEWESIEFNTINEFDMTWEGIERAGGLHVLNKRLRDRYGIE